MGVYEGDFLNVFLMNKYKTVLPTEHENAQTTYNRPDVHRARWIGLKKKSVTYENIRNRMRSRPQCFLLKMFIFKQYMFLL